MQQSTQAPKHTAPAQGKARLLIRLGGQVYIHSGADDTWADPLGEYLGAHEACPAYNLLGKSTALGSATPPPLGEPVLEGSVGYHCRPGGHSVEDYDWVSTTPSFEVHTSFLEAGKKQVKCWATGALYGLCASALEGLTDALMTTLGVANDNSTRDAFIQYP